MQIYEKWHLTGKDESFIQVDKSGQRIHRDIIAPLTMLHSQALEQGFELAIVSGYRSFARQLKIWNAKASGERDVLDDQGLVIDITRLTPWQQVQAILRWSALPGASRHHWGTDIDVYDQASVSCDYSPMLSLEEVEDTGPFGPMHCWLDQRIADGASFGFFRPYTCHSGGVAPERWHLSYAPLSAKFQSELTVAQLVASIIDEPLALKDTVLNHIDEIYQRFVAVPAMIYPQQYRNLFSAARN